MYAHHACTTQTVGLRYSQSESCSLCGSYKHAINILTSIHSLHCIPAAKKSNVPSVLPERYKQQLLCMLYNESEAIAIQFFELTSRTINVLEEEGASVVKLKKYVSRFPMTKKDSTPTLADVVQPADDVDDVFCILERNHFLTFYNFKILESIIRKLCKGNVELKKELEEHKSHFEEYIKRRVCESSLYFGGVFTPGDACTPEEGCNLVLITDEKWDRESSLKAVLGLKKNVADIFEIKDFVFCLERIEENCLRLYYCIPTFLEIVILSIKQEQVQSLICSGVAEICCAGHHIVLQTCRWKLFLIIITNITALICLCR